MRFVFSKIFIVPYLSILLHALAGVAYAADQRAVQQRVLSSASASSVSQSQTEIRANTSAPNSVQIKSNSAVTTVVSPGAAQSLNPQPLPPGGARGVRPGQTSITPAISPGATQSLNPQPLPPKGTGGMRTGPGLITPVVSPGAAQSLNPQPLPPVGSPRNSHAIARGTLFNATNDRAIIIVGGKQMSVVELKKNLSAEIARKAGAPTIMKSTIRPQKIEETIKADRSVRKTPSKPVYTDAKPHNLGEIHCPNQGKGGPKINEVSGKLQPGKRITIWGECFGERSGRIEIIGQFRGGKLTPAFSEWGWNNVEVEIPANISGALDHVVAVTVIAADGKTSSAVQAQYVASRERVDVPDRLWSPNSTFELTSNEESDVPATPNKARQGQATKSLRINTQCSLDTMELTALAGRVTKISGFEQGPPNEATVTLEWEGTCTDRYKSSFTFLNPAIGREQVEERFISACRVAFQTRAWAYCPAGIAP